MPRIPAAPAAHPGISVASQGSASAAAGAAAFLRVLPVFQGEPTEAEHRVVHRTLTTLRAFFVRNVMGWIFEPPPRPLRRHARA
jgi:hypothetical protein